MDFFDLLFIALFFANIITLAVAAISTLRGRRAHALSLLRRWALCATIYLAIVFVVSLATPRRLLRVGDPQCSDDWCMAVEDVQRTPLNADISYAVTLRLFSRARPAALSLAKTIGSTGPPSSSSIDVTKPTTGPGTREPDRRD